MQILVQLFELGERERWGSFGAGKREADEDDSERYQRSKDLQSTEPRQ